MQMQKQGNTVMFLPGAARAHAQCFSARHAVLLSVVTLDTEQRKRVRATWEGATCLSVFTLGQRPEMTAQSVMHRKKGAVAMYVRKKLQ